MLTYVSFAQENLEIKKIRITGEKATHKSMIKESMTLESTSWFKRKILKRTAQPFTRELYNEDIESIIAQYQKEGYLDISIDEPLIELTKNQKKVKLTIHVNDGEPVRVSEVSYTVDSTKTLSEALPRKENKNVLFQSELTSSTIFSDKSFYNDQLLIAEEFSNIGYPFAKIDYNLSVDTLAKEVDIHWSVDKGQLVYFGLTVVTGNEKVPAKSIFRQLAYKPGDIWSKKKIDQTQRQIYNQGMFRVASVRTQIDNMVNDTLPVRIQIKEAPRWTTRFGAGYGREDKFRTFAELQLLGFGTKTGRLELFGKHSGLEPYSFYLRFSQPSVFFPNNTLSLYPYVQAKNEPGYHLDKIGFNISMLQNFSKQLNTSFGYQFEDVQLDTIGSLQPVLDSTESYYTKSGLLIGGIYTTADPLLDPVQGHVISLNVKTNGIFAKTDLPFYRLLFEYKRYIGIRNGLTLAVKGKIGGIQRTDKKQYIPADERFYAGGSHSVRGWSRSALGPKDEAGVPIGGNSLLEGSVEARVSLSKMLILSVFCDGGNVWPESFNYHINDLRYSAGTGLKIKTPIGPAGIDFARPIFDSEDKWQIHFSIGHSF